MVLNAASVGSNDRLAIDSDGMKSVNGVQTVDYIEEDPTIDTTGVVCPQIHGGPPSEAWYKDITIVDLTR